MKKNSLTIIIQPDTSLFPKGITNFISFSVPKRVISYLLIAVVFFVAFGANGVWCIKNNFTIKKKVAVLQADIKQISGIAAEVDSIREEEKIIREFIGIEAWGNNFDINERMGKGGTATDNDFEMSQLDVEIEVKQLTDNRPLNVRVFDLRDDVHELLSALSRMTETLTCRPTIMPVKDKAIWISSGFGWRKSPFTGLRQFHKGLDISGRKGAQIIVTADGVVIKVGYNRFIGKYVTVKHDDRFETSYGHLLKYIVKKGQKIKRGEVIGYMGTSGMSTGYHLHYTVVDNKKNVNPYNFILNRNELTLVASR